MVSVDTSKSGKFFRFIIRGLEIVTSVIILIVIVTLMVKLFDRIILNGEIWEMTGENFNEFLADSLSLVVGLEFVILLTRHRAKDLVEVIMFAIARQIIVEHLKMYEILIGVIALGLLFAIRKYFLINVGLPDSVINFFGEKRISMEDLKEEFRKEEEEQKENHI